MYGNWPCAKYGRIVRRHSTANKAYPLRRFADAARRVCLPLAGPMGILRSANRADHKSPYGGGTMRGLKLYFWCVVLFTLIAFAFGIWLGAGLNSAN